MQFIASEKRDNLFSWDPHPWVNVCCFFHSIRSDPPPFSPFVSKYGLPYPSPEFLNCLTLKFGLRDSGPRNLETPSESKDLFVIVSPPLALLFFFRLCPLSLPSVVTARLRLKLSTTLALPSVCPETGVLTLLSLGLNLLNSLQSLPVLKGLLCITVTVTSTGTVTALVVIIITTKTTSSTAFKASSTTANTDISTIAVESANAGITAKAATVTATTIITITIGEPIRPERWIASSVSTSKTTITAYKTTPISLSVIPIVPVIPFVSVNVIIIVIVIDAVVVFVVIV